MEYIFAGIILLIVVFTSFFTNFNAKNSIVDFLSERGATNIIVSRKWFSSDRDTLTFFVEFTHPNGKKVSSHCKLQYFGLFLDSKIFWSEPINLEFSKEDTTQFVLSQLSEQIKLQLNKELPTYEITTAIPIPNSEDKIVMLKYIKPFNNVFRCKNDGKVIWQADLPTSMEDVYTHITWQDNQLIAFSRSCIMVTIDSETGKFLSSKI